MSLPPRLRETEPGELCSLHLPAVSRLQPGSPTPPEKGDQCASWEADLRLVEACVSGDGVACDALARRLVRCVMGYLRTLCRRSSRPLSQADLDDLAQEVCVRVYERKATFRGHASLETWVSGFSLRYFLRGPSRRAHRTASEHELEGHADPASEMDERIERSHFITRYAKGLSKNERRVVLDRYLRGLTLKEIARELGVDPSTVNTHHRRALEKIRANLREEEA